MTDFDKAKTTADEVLTENYITQPPVPINTIVKNYGFEVVEVELPPNVAGLVDISSHRIFINKGDSDTRKAFTVAHELGHIKLHSDELTKNPNIGILYRRPLGHKDDDAKEQEANFFAASLLVPQSMYDEVLKQYKNVLPENRIELLSSLFGVSQEVMGYRLNHFNHK
jgi:Zn-dependent peptidase ImmA (M78 family)